MNLALFDLDNTILAGDSDYNWSRFLIQKGYLDGIIHAEIKISENGKEVIAESSGGGPVDATFKAIEKIAKSGSELQLYSCLLYTSDAADE